MNFDSGESLRRCVDSVVRHAPAFAWEAVVVDSASRDGSAGFLADPPPGVRLLRLPTNAGFTAGINTGFRATTGELVLLLNPDMVVLPGALDAIVRPMDDPQVGAVGGHCTRPDGAFEWRYVHRFPTPRTAYMASFVPAARARRRRAFRDYVMEGADVSRPLDVPQPAGGCLLLRRSLFGDALASERFGIFWSDVDVAWTVRAAGKRAIVVPDARFVHDHSSPRVSSQEHARLATDYYVGAYRYFRLRAGRRQAWAVKVLFAFGLTRRLALKALEVARGRAVREELRQQAGCLRDFLRDRNPFLAAAGLPP